MGYRISLYVCDRKYVESLKDMTQEDADKTGYGFIENLQKNQIKYDTLANVLDTGHEVEDGLCSRMFSNKLDIEDDMSFYTISREQLINIIEYIRKNNIYDFLMSRTIDYDACEKSGDKFFDANVRNICMEARSDAESWGYGWKADDGKYTYLNIDLSENRWWISDGITYRYAIFNMVHILKIFDWDNDVLVAIGG